MDQAPLEQRYDPIYVRFAAAYSQLGRAMYRMLSIGGPAAIERHRLDALEQTKEAWSICKRFGVGAGAREKAA